VASKRKPGVILLFKQEDAGFAVCCAGLPADGIAKQTNVWQAKHGRIASGSCKVS
jgi:hypothetical protein